MCTCVCVLDDCKVVQRRFFFRFRFNWLNESDWGRQAGRQTGRQAGRQINRVYVSQLCVYIFVLCDERRKREFNSEESNLFVSFFVVRSFTSFDFNKSDFHSVDYIVFLSFSIAFWCGAFITMSRAINRLPNIPYLLPWSAVRGMRYLYGGCRIA